MGPRFRCSQLPFMHQAFTDCKRATLPDLVPTDCTRQVCREVREQVVGVKRIASCLHFAFTFA